MAEQAHSHTAKSRRPDVITWVLQQEAPRKQVLLQVLSGTPEHACAESLGLTLKQVHDVEQWFADEAPAFIEDDYVMSYHAARDMEEFCRVTGQDEYINRMLELKDPKKSYPTQKGAVITHRSPKDAPKPKSSDVCIRHVADTSMPLDDAAKKRREERMAARIREKENRLSRNQNRAYQRMGDAPEKDPAYESGPVRGASGRLSTPIDMESTAPGRIAYPSQPQQPRRDIWRSRSEELAEIAERVCKQCASTSMKPIAFSDFMRAFRHECNIHDWTTKAEESSSTLRDTLAHDARVMWTGDNKFWFFDWKKHARTISQAIEDDALVDHEYSTRYFYRREQRLMQRLSVKTPEELYEILHHIYTDAEGEAVFGNHLSFGFGKIDRQKQVKRFAAKHAGQPKDILAAEYEQEYGFLAVTVAIWIDLFAEPAGLSPVQRTERKAVREKACKSSPKAEPPIHEEIRQQAPSAPAAYPETEPLEAMKDKSVPAHVPAPAPAPIPVPVQAPVQVPAPVSVQDPSSLAAPAQAPAPEPAPAPIQSHTQAPASALAPTTASIPSPSAAVPAADKPGQEQRQASSIARLISRITGLFHGAHGLVARLRALVSRFGGQSSEQHKQPSQHGLPSLESKAGFSDKTAVTQNIDGETENVSGNASPMEACEPEAATMVTEESAAVEAPAEVQIAPEAKPEAHTVAAFLSRELSEDICDANLVQARFRYEFPHEPDITQDDQTLYGAGYYKDHDLLFKGGLTPREHFMQLLASRPSFSRGDSGFGEAVWRHPAFQHLLHEMLASHQVLLYENPDIYIAFSRLHKAMDVSMADIESYAPAVAAAVPEMTPFTIGSLRNGLKVVHVLHDLDMPNGFYEGLLETSGLLQSCTLAGTKVFASWPDSHFSAGSFIEWFVSMHEGVYREDVPGLLRKDYGIDCPMTLLVATIYNSNIYHDDIWDAYYSSMEAWKQEARNELA